VGDSITAIVGHFLLRLPFPDRVGSGLCGATWVGGFAPQHFQPGRGRMAPRDASPVGALIDDILRLHLEHAVSHWSAWRGLDEVVARFTVGGVPMLGAVSAVRLGTANAWTQMGCVYFTQAAFSLLVALTRCCPYVYQGASAISVG